MIEYIYQVEMFINVRTEDEPLYDWVTEKRFYRGEKQLTDFDLHEVPGKRKNAKFLGTIEVKTNF